MPVPAQVTATVPVGSVAPGPPRSTLSRPLHRTFTRAAGSEESVTRGGGAAGDPRLLRRSAWPDRVAESADTLTIPETAMVDPSTRTAVPSQPRLRRPCGDDNRFGAVRITGTRSENRRSCRFPSMVAQAEGSQDRASGGAHRVFPCAGEIIRRPASLSKTVHRGHAGHRRKHSRVQRTQHRVPHVRGDVAHETCVRASGTGEGWKRGRGPSAFFSGGSIVSGAPRTSLPAHPMRDPVNRLLARPRRERAGPSALRDFARSRIRCSPRMVRGASVRHHPRLMTGDEHGGVPLKKILMASCRASVRLPFPTSSGKLRAPRHGRRAGHGVARGELATASRDVRRATRSAMNEMFAGCAIISGAPRTSLPASPDARSREPSPRTTAAGTRRLSRAPRLCKTAHQVFVEAGPGALPIMAPCRASVRLPFPTSSATECV